MKVKLNLFFTLRINYALKGVHLFIYLLAIWGLILKNKFNKSSIGAWSNQQKIVILSHSKIWMIEDFQTDNFFNGNITEIPLQHYSQKEAITFKNDTVVEVESYRIADFKTVPSAYEGHYLHSKVETVVEEQTVSLKPGDLIIPTNQRYSRFIHSVLQPKTEDSYFAWNFFDSYVQQKEYFSAYVFEDRAAEILRGDPALKLAFEEKKRLDDKFRDSSWEQLYYIYRNSSNFEPSWHRLPVYQLY